MNRLHHPGRSTPSRGGFSLVEVALALAVMGFACVSMIGLIPVGLGSFQKAMGNVVESSIVQNLTNDILLANFSDLYQYDYANNGNLVYCYNNEGSPTVPPTAVTTALPAGTVYMAKVTMVGLGSTNSPAGLAQTGGTTGGGGAVSTTTSSNTSAYNVTITITNVSNPLQQDAFPLIVANNNQ